ncbi:MOSC domain-containing protein [Pseudorhodoferax sp. Leaf274]|uniref:MOSC domain-containing protein n=1 Tax=Pseudorhodoferax sp. Leaf274 TaxID=1736318 RepID=UPI00070350C9|nr:MOSC domain-containing protein [Pseudorhodoferax sp. Leaf274]KQP49915.1 molybdenum cofactor biosysynthesis protein [Pseudorhodoferax sp. Leaf274]
MRCEVVKVSRSAQHTFSKAVVERIELVQGHGVRDDAHCGTTVKHRSRVAKDPTKPNLRQVHLLSEELLAEFSGDGPQVLPGQLGENITTRGIDLLALSPGTQLRLGAHAVIEITGLRNPCAQIERFRSGLLAAVRPRAADGSVVRKAGVMAIVVAGGVVHPGDAIAVLSTPAKRKPLVPV